MAELNVENLTKPTQIIESEKKVQKLSVCGVIKNNASEIIQKLELEMPIVFQGYSDLYSRYLHSIKDIFGVCHIAEKQYFDKFEVDQNTLKAFDDYFKSINDVSKYQIDLFQNFLKYYFQNRLSFVDSSDKYFHSMMNIYAKTLSQFIQR